MLSTLLLLAGEITEDDSIDLGSLLWLVLIVLAIIALIVYIKNRA